MYKVTSTLFNKTTLLEKMSENVRRFLMAHQHSQGIYCHSCWFTLENTGEKAN